MNPTVTHSVDRDQIGWIVFDDPAARVNVLTPAVFADLRAALAALAAQPVKAVVVLSAKERIFIAGADLKWLAQLPDAAAAIAVSREGQACFALLANFKVPKQCIVVDALPRNAMGKVQKNVLRLNWGQSPGLGVLPNR